MKVTAKEVNEILKKSGLELDVDVLDEKKLLRDQGVDSLKKMELFLAVEESLDMKVPDEDFDKIKTLDDLAEYINGRAEK